MALVPCALFAEQACTFICVALVILAFVHLALHRSWLARLTKGRYALSRICSVALSFATLVALAVACIMSLTAGGSSESLIAHIVALALVLAHAALQVYLQMIAPHRKDGGR